MVFGHEKVELEQEEDQMVFVYDVSPDPKANYIEEKNEIYQLLFILDTKSIIEYLYKLHKEDGHKGISSFRKYILKINNYFEGYTYLTEYIVKNCITYKSKKIS